MSLHDNLKSVIEVLDDQPKVIRAAQETIEWYPKSKVLFFSVRGTWQCLFLNGAHVAKARLAKAEMYAPILVALLERCDDFKALLGEIEIIVLNPVEQSLTKMEDWTEVKKATRHNCKERGDSEDSIEERVKSVDAEAPAWKRLIENGATEYVGWPFAEYRYPEEGVARSRVLIQARSHLLEGKPSLQKFLRPDAEIRGIRR